MLTYIKHQDALREHLDVMELVNQPVTEIIWRVQEIDHTEYWMMVSQLQVMGHKLTSPFDALMNRWDDAQKMKGWWTVTGPATTFEAEQAVVLASPPEHKLQFYHFVETGEHYWVLADKTLKLGVEMMLEPLRFRPVSEEYINWVKYRVWRKDD